MQYNILGRSGIKVSRLCFGTLTMAPMQQNMTPEEGARLLVYAYNKGVRFLDTADLYDTYPHIRRALIDAPDYIISSKAYCYDEKTASEALERAFRGLGRDYVDIFMLHEQESLYTLRGHEEALDYLVRQKELGHIGAVGVSTHFAGCVKAAVRFPQIDVIHPLINKGGIGIQDGDRALMEENIRLARDKGRGIFAMKPFGGGHLISSAYESLKYLAEADWVDSVAAGMQSLEEIDANVAVINGDANAEELMGRLHGRKRRILVHDWCEGCGRCAARCRQNAIAITDGRAVIDQAKCVYCGYCARVCPQFCIKVV